jgi:glutathione S-transferase
MSSSPLELFWISGSPFSWRVMLTLEAKQIPYTAHLLQGSRGDHKKPEYLALNPRGKVPTLRDGAVIVSESIAIMEYVEKRFPARPMFGRSALETALIWRVMSEFSSYLEAPLFRVAVALLAGKIPNAAADLRAALPEVYTELSKLESRLADIPWLAGTELTAADATIYPFLALLTRGALKGAGGELELKLLPFHEHYPRLATWMERVERLPGYGRTYPPHWRG